MTQEENRIPTTENYHIIFGEKRAKYNAVFNELVKQYYLQHGNVNGGIADKMFRVYKIWNNYADKNPFINKTLHP